MRLSLLPLQTPPPKVVIAKNISTGSSSRTWMLQLCTSPTANIWFTKQTYRKKLSRKSEESGLTLNQFRFTLERFTTDAIFPLCQKWCTWCWLTLKELIIGFPVSFCGGVWTWKECRGKYQQPICPYIRACRYVGTSVRSAADDTDKVNAVRNRL